LAVLDWVRVGHANGDAGCGEASRRRLAWRYGRKEGRKTNNIQLWMTTHCKSEKAFLLPPPSNSSIDKNPENREETHLVGFTYRTIRRV
jgi:hypothetical protein